MTKGKVEFTATILSHNGMDACYIEIPEYISEALGAKGRMKVKASFDTCQYRGSIARMKTKCHLLIITKEIRAKINKGVGEEVTVCLEADLEERKVELPESLILVFEKDKEAAQAFNKLSYTHQKEHIMSINDAKKEETRIRRIEKMLELLKKPK
jgi:hypothetical protein